MAKNDSMWLGAAIVVAAFLIMSPGETGPGDTGGVDLCKVVDAEASFTGQRMFVAGTATTSDFVRVLKINGDGITKDLGYTSLDSGSLSTAPGGKYKLMYGENSTTYYASVKDYTAPCQDATDDKTGVLCQMDTSPTITVFDEYGNVQSATANAQALSTDGEVDIKVRVKASSDTCFGNPDAPKDNAICFLYNTSTTKTVKVGTGSVGIPYNVSYLYATTGKGISCYNLDKIADNEEVDIPVEITAMSVDPSIESNITVMIEDIDFDLNADTLEEIWGFEDEDNNALGVPVQTGTIYIS